MSDLSVYEKLDFYGVQYDGEQGPYVEQEEHMRLVEFAMNKGAKVTRVRWIGSRWEGYDLSYMHGVLPNGKSVRIEDAHLAVSLCPLFKRKGALIEWAKSEGVFAKGLGMLDESVWSTLHG